MGWAYGTIDEGNVCLLG